MNIEKCLKLSEYARRDKTLTRNHSSGKGVDFYIKKHLAEVNTLLQIVEEDDEFVDRLHQEKTALNSALLVYA
jgi:hypothetical protein